MASDESQPYFGSDAEIYVFVVGVLVAIFSFIACVMLIHSISKDPGIKDKVINYPSIFSAVFYFISSVLFLFFVVYFDSSSNDNLAENDDRFVITFLLFLFFLILAKLAIYTQFFTRLFISFRNSVLALNRCTIIIFITLLCLQFITVIWGIVLICVRYLDDQDYSSYYEQFSAVFVLLFLFDFALSWLLVSLFTNKLFRTMMFKSRSEFFAKTERYLRGNNVRTTKEESPSSRQALNVSDHDNLNGNHSEALDDQNEEEKALELNDLEQKPDVVQRARVHSKSHPESKGQHEHKPSILRERRESFLIDIAYASIDEGDKRGLDMITRNFLLSTMSIITAQLVYASLIILAILNGDDEFEFNQSILLWVYGGVFYPSDVILSCCSLYLNYKFAQEYYRCLCHCCHERCGMWMVRRASVKILRKHSIQLTKLDLDLEKSMNA